ncbi:hypothetical protein UCRPC4_g04605 [Phaeomoniella chlamydospora]|uniref:Uncharacterized protein n=1 Tax=Phaeomoniella chlamydospora TaxID=158046 RepID=A0A0G2EA70_PHACM|nr:hypothetical protein UCRPC4_g04605 [Phaeomoniella chlamydospora]
MASMGIKDSLDDGHGVGQYYGSGTAASPSSLSGAGRGRYGRDTSRRLSGRNPLGASVNGSNAWAGRSNRRDPLTETSQDLKSKPSDQGIISAAIANATALLRKPLHNGQENTSLLDQQSKSPPTNSQFTFTYESDNTKGITFPEQSLYSAGYAQRAASMPSPTASNQRYSAQGTQTSPNTAAPGPAQTQGLHGTPNTTQGKKPRRRRGDIYALQARQRKLQQEYANLHHPPSLEEMWICEFCEYESIFGELPHALIRQYEIKDRKERRKAAEKRRLLEKAKMKGRKGKKQTKNANKAANTAAHQNTNQQAYDQQGLEQGGMGLQGDEYLDEGYDDEPVPMPTPPQAPVKQSMPGAYETPMPGAGGRGTATKEAGTGGGGGGGGGKI